MHNKRVKFARTQRGLGPAKSAGPLPYSLCLKMNANIRVVIMFFVALLIASVTIGFNEIDPFFDTKTTVPATIIHKVYATGKTGGRIEITVKTNNGKKYWFNHANDSVGRQGDEITLRVYKRKLTGIQKYELNY